MHWHVIEPFLSRHRFFFPWTRQWLKHSNPAFAVWIPSFDAKSQIPTVRNTPRFLRAFNVPHNKHTMTSGCYHPWWWLGVGHGFASQKRPWLVAFQTVTAPRLRIAMATFEVVRGGTAAALKIRLPDQAAVLAENDALVSKTQNVPLDAKDGFIKIIKTLMCVKQY